MKDLVSEFWGRLLTETINLYTAVEMELRLFEQVGLYISVYSGMVLQFMIINHINFTYHKEQHPTHWPCTHL